MGTENQEQGPQASGSSALRKALAMGTTPAALLRCLPLGSVNFWIENYASAAVEMQMFGNKIHG